MLPIIWQLVGMLILGFGFGVVAHDCAVISGMFEQDPKIRPIHGFVVGLPMIAIGALLLVL